MPPPSFSSSSSSSFSTVPPLPSTLRILVAAAPTLATAMELTAWKVVTSASIGAATTSTSTSTSTSKSKSNSSSSSSSSSRRRRTRIEEEGHTIGPRPPSEAEACRDSDTTEGMFDLLMLLGPCAASTASTAATAATYSERRLTPPPPPEKDDDEREEEEEEEEEDEGDEIPGRLPPVDPDTWVGQAAMEGDVVSMVGLLENVVCRVVALPARGRSRGREEKRGRNEGGGEEGRGGGRGREEEGIALTPTALNVHDKCVKLLPGLFLGGYAFAKEEEEEEERSEEGGVVGRTLEVAGCLAEEGGEGGIEGGWGMVMMECLPPLSASATASSSPPPLPPPPPRPPSSSSSSSSSPSFTDHLMLRVRHREGKKKGGRGGGSGGGRVETQGKTTVLETGNLSEGHLAVVTLRRKEGREGGWAVDKVEMEVLPSFRVGRERGEEKPPQE